MLFIPTEITVPLTNNSCTVNNNNVRSMRLGKVNSKLSYQE